MFRSKSFVLYFIIANILVVFSNLPLLQLEYRKPKDYINTFSPHWPYDYFSHIYIMSQGKEGNWLRNTPYSTEKSYPSLFHIFYILTGKIAIFFPWDSIFQLSCN